MISNNSILRERGFQKLCLVLGLIMLAIFIPTQYQINENQKLIDAAMKRWQQEHDAVEIMNCDELREGLLYNTILASDNSQRATERYVAGCIPK
jgi:hypothetical protein